LRLVGRIGKRKRSSENAAAQPHPSTRTPPKQTELEDATAWANALEGSQRQAREEEIKSLLHDYECLNDHDLQDLGSPEEVDSCTPEDDQQMVALQARIQSLKDRLEAARGGGALESVQHLAMKRQMVELEDEASHLRDENEDLKEELDEVVQLKNQEVFELRKRNEDLCQEVLKWCKQAGVQADPPAFLQHLAPPPSGGISTQLGVEMSGAEITTA